VAKFVFFPSKLRKQPFAEKFKIRGGAPLPTPIDIVCSFMKHNIRNTWLSEVRLLITISCEMLIT